MPSNRRGIKRHHTNLPDLQDIVEIEETFIADQAMQKMSTDDREFINLQRQKKKEEAEREKWRKLYKR